MKQKTVMIITIVIVVLLAAAALIIVPNIIMVYSVKDKIVCTFDSSTVELSREEKAQISEFDAQCIIVPGASVYPNGNPSPMLRNRLDAAVAIYKSGGARAVLLSGDNGEQDYNEVRVMARYIMNEGVPEEDIFCDFAGFSTYETAYRAKEIFGVSRAIIVTQSYHMYRAAYGCSKMGIQVMGVASDQQNYKGQFMRDVREIMARTKDVFKWAARPEPTYLGDRIPITGKGNCKF